MSIPAGLSLEQLRGLALAALDKCGWPRHKLRYREEIINDTQWREWLREAGEKELREVLTWLDVSLPSWEYGEIRVGYLKPKRESDQRPMEQA